QHARTPALFESGVSRGRPPSGLLCAIRRQGRAGAASGPCIIRRRTIDGTVVTEGKPNFIEAQCAAKGMRMTEQRRVIARVLADSADHPDVEELYRRCAKVDQHISISTVYRT